MKRIIKSGEIVKINGIPLSICQDVEVETHDGNAPMVWDESGEILRGTYQPTAGPVADFCDEQPVIVVDKILEVIAETFGTCVGALKAPIRLQNSEGAELGEFVVESLVVALVSKIVVNKEEAHSCSVIGSEISLENAIGQTRRAEAEVDQTPSSASPAPPCSGSFLHWMRCHLEDLNMVEKLYGKNSSEYLYQQNRANESFSGNIAKLLRLGLQGVPSHRPTQIEPVDTLQGREYFASLPSRSRAAGF